MTLTPFITISFTEDGRMATQFNPFQKGGCDPVKVGVALASATRVITEAFMKELKFPEGEREQIQAAIVEVYNRDMGWESMGEEETTELKPI